MLGYTLGSLAGSPYDRVNLFSEDFELFSSHHVSVLRDVEFRQNRWYQERDYEVHQTGELAVSAATMRFLMDTSPTGVDRSHHRNAKGFADSVEGFEDDFGNLPEMSEDLLPAAVMPLAYAARNREELLNLTEVVCRHYFGDEATQFIPVMQVYAETLFKLREGESLEAVSSWLESENLDLDLYSHADTIRTSGNDSGAVWENSLFLDDDIASLSPNKDLFRSVLCGLKAGIEGSSFEESLRYAVSLGGDSSVVAGIAGSVSQMVYCPPVNREEFKRLEVMANDFVQRDYVKLVEAFDKFVSNPAMVRYNILQLRAKAKADKGLDVVDGITDAEFAAQHRTDSGSLYVPKETNMDPVERESRKRREMPFPKVTVLRLSPIERHYYLDGSDKELAARLKIRFGEENVFVGKDANVDFENARSEWKKKKELRFGHSAFGGRDDCPQLLTRYFVPDMKIKVRGEKGALITKYQDSVVPVWRLAEQYYNNYEKMQRDVDVMTKRFKSLDTVKFLLKKEISKPHAERNAENLAAFERGVLILGKDKFGGWGKFALECFKEFKTAERARAALRSAWKRYERADDDMKPALKKAYLDIREKYDALSYLEEYMPARSMVTAAVESYEVLSAVKKGIHEAFVDQFGEQDGQVFEHVYGCSFGDSSRVSDSKSPVWYEALTDGFNIHHGDIITGSLMISPETGRLEYNKNADRGVTDQRGRLLVVPPDFEPVQWILDSVKYNLFDDMSFQDNKVLQEAIEDSKKGGPYEVNVNKNVELLEDMVSRSKDTHLLEGLGMSRGRGM